MGIDEKRRSNVINSLMRGAGINFVAFVVRFLFIFIQSFLAVRLFGTDQFGVYIVAISAVNLLSYAGQLGFSRTVVRYVALYIERNEWCNISRFLQFMLAVTIVWSAAIGIGLNFATEYLQMLFSEVSLLNVLIVIGFAIPCLTLATLLGAFTQGFGVMQHKAIAIDMLAPALEVGLLIVFWHLGLQENGLMLSYTISLGVVCILLSFVTYRFLCMAKNKTIEGFSHEAVAIRPIIRFTAFAWVSLLLRHATRPVNIFVIGVLGTATMVGIYSVLERLVAVGAVFLMSINAMFAPLVSRLVEAEDYVQLGRMYALAARWSLCVCLPVFVMLAVYGEEILYLFGAEFVEGASALWYLAGAWIFSLSTGPADVILMMSGRSHYSAINQIIMVGIMVMLGIWLIPMWGLIGAVFGFAIATVVVNILRVLQVQMHLKIHPFGLPTTKVLVAGVFMLAILLILPTTMSAEFYGTWQGDVTIALIGLLVYLLVLVLLRLETEEFQALNVLRLRIQLIKN